jgi:hypothetical protein
MCTSTLASAVLLQDTLSEGNTRLLMIFIGIAAFALLAQAVVMVSMAVGASKAQKAIMVHIEDINGKLLPLLDKSNVLVAELSPQIKEITARVTAVSGNVDEISALVRAKIDEFGPTISAANETILEANRTVQDANRKTQLQVDRVNGMVTSVLDATSQMGRAIQSGIATPVREVSSIVEGVKAGVVTFLNGSRRR